MHVLHDFYNANLDALSTDISSVQLRDGSGGVLFPVKGDKGKALASVVHVHDAPALLKLSLQFSIGKVLIHPVDEELAALLSHGGTGALQWVGTAVKETPLKGVNLVI